MLGYHEIGRIGSSPVSYTHLDVYKRQVYMIQKEYGKALEPLLKAEKINPRDFVVLSNIAQAYKLQGDKINAMKYYALTIKYGDEQSREFARGQMEDLKKQ